MAPLGTPDRVVDAELDASGITIGDVGLQVGGSDVSTSNPVPMISVNPVAGATLTNVSDAATSVSLLASNAAREGASFFNDSTSSLFLKYGATASATSFTVKIAPGGYFEMPTPVYTGAIDGIWTADSTGAVRITELS